LPADRRIAAIVVAYNGGDDLARCVRSLLAQTVRDLEVIVVDNASMDGSVERLEAAFGSTVRVIRRESNGGYGVGANTGWRSTDAAFVAIFNQDVTADPDCLARMRQVLIDEPRDAIVSPKLVLASDRRHVNAVGNDVHLSCVAWCRGLGTPADGWHGVEEVTAVSGAAFMARRALLESLGGVDESFYMYMEDVDLSFRARLAGAACLVACDAVASHDWSLALGPKKFGYLERNRRRVWDRHIGPGEGRWLVLLQVELMSWMYAALRGRRHLAAKWRAARVGRERQPVNVTSPEIIVPVLSPRYPYHVLFPRSRTVARLGPAVDAIVTWWLRFGRRSSPVRTT
jgi:GT2 family glycosyltransferase